MLAPRDTPETPVTSEYFRDTGNQRRINRETGRVGPVGGMGPSERLMKLWTGLGRVWTGLGRVWTGLGQPRTGLDRV